MITKGKTRATLIENVGHINVYNFDKLKNQIEEHTGKILSFFYTNTFQYYLLHVSDLRTKMISSIATHFYRISPTLSSIIFCDFVMMLVKCY